jgi:enoyl-CoA hydratase/carnithine racemase
VSEAILVERDGAIATVTLNRPERLNALDKAMWSRLGSAMQELDGDDSLRCIVLRGAGDRAFAAGADISEFHAERANSKQAQAYSEGGIGWLQAVAECRHPTLALIQGACVGGGLLIASQCDLRICNESARFGVPVKNLGLTESYDELAGMLRLLGPAASLEILLEGRIWNAREAYEKGLGLARRAGRQRSRGSVRGGAPHRRRRAACGALAQEVHPAAARSAPALGRGARRRLRVLRHRGFPRGGCRVPREAQASIHRNRNRRRATPEAQRHSAA